MVPEHKAGTLSNFCVFHGYSGKHDEEFTCKYTNKLNFYFYFYIFSTVGSSGNQW